jgi:hypothetical protein
VPAPAASEQMPVAGMDMGLPSTRDWLKVIGGAARGDLLVTFVKPGHVTAATQPEVSGAGPVSPSIYIRNPVGRELFHIVMRDLNARKVWRCVWASLHFTIWL